MLMTGAIPLKEAQAKVLANCKPLDAEPVQSLLEARGRVLAEAVRAPRDLPQAPTSIVDGYAVCSSDFAGEDAATFSVQRQREDGAAGSAAPAAELQTMEAVYLTTGALLPPRADAVRPSEESTVIESEEDTNNTGCKRRKVQLTSCEHGKWVRWPGSDMTSGSIILPVGHLLTAMDLSALAAAGQVRPLVHRRPKVVVLSTGRELLDPEAHASDLPREKIFDANRHMLLALAAEEGADVTDFNIVGDDRSCIKDALGRAVSSADVVICSGGVSEGDFDFVRPVLCELGKLLFEKVVIKPGKPASCAVLDRAMDSGASSKVLLFGLPGNPASAAVTFQLLVAPALQRLLGRSDLGQPVLPVKVKETVAADPQRPEWVRASLAWEGSQLVAMHTGLQRSSRAASLAGADALLVLSAGQRVQAGETVNALIITAVPGNSCKLDDPAVERRLEAATFRKLVAHFRENPQVQNIDLMNLSGFCRNCLSKWYMKSANAGGFNIDYDAAREVVYGMPYERWKNLHQTPASDAQKSAFEKSGHGHSHSGDAANRCDKKNMLEAEANTARNCIPDADAEKFEAAAFCQLVHHFRENPQVQNIDVMNLAGFCRNCLSKWYKKAAEEEGLSIDYDMARERVYGMSYDEWKKKYQTSASPEQLQTFNATASTHAPRAAPKHSDVCSGGTEQGVALEALEAATKAGSMGLSSASSALLRVGVLTVSDRASAKIYEDLSGPAVADVLQQCLKHMQGYQLLRIEHSIVPDERDDIERTLRDWTAGSDPLNLILTTGGTGFAPRDVTPEATRAVCDKDAPGLALATLQAGAQHQPLAFASRLTAGVRRRTVILNLPGNPTAIGQCLQPVVPLLLRAVALCDQPSESRL